MAKYRKKPIVIEAIQFHEKEYIHNKSKYENFNISDMGQLSEMWFDKGVEDGRYYVKTLEGNMVVSEGDYIIKGIQGECYPCKPDIFHRTYVKIN